MLNQKVIVSLRRLMDVIQIMVIQQAKRFILESFKYPESSSRTCGENIQVLCPLVQFMLT